MKDAEDEAFDELAKRQGHWGGGFMAKKAMAMDKMQEPDEALTLEALKYAASKGYGRIVRENSAPFTIKESLAQPEQEPVCDKDPQGCWNVRCQLGKQCKNLAQPAQEPTSGDYALGYAEGFNDACKKPAQEPVAWPKAKPAEQIIGWTVDYKFLESLSDAADGRPSMETVESVLLLAARQMKSAAPPQPAHEPVALVIDGVLVKSALPEKYTGHLYTTPPLPAQEPEMLTIAYQSGYYDGKKAALAQPAQEQWNAALDHAAERIGEIAAFPKTTQDSFAVFIRGLKK